MVREGSFRSKRDERRAIPGLAFASVLVTTLVAATAPARPAVLEPGFTVEYFKDCGTTLNGFRHGSILDAACTPGGPWGDYVYLAVYTLGLDDYGSKVEKVDFSGNVSYEGGFGFGAYASHLAFSPVGWREGDSFFVTVNDIYGDTRCGRWSPSDDYLGPCSSYAFDHVGAVAVDPSGAFGNDLFIDGGSGGLHGVFRVDELGNTTLFSSVGGVGKFGPGGAWGVGLYGDGVVLDPDGTATPFPGGFGLTFDWAFGPGFEGDMFSRCPGGICRVKPDGSRTLWADGLPGDIEYCGGALWIGGSGCLVVSRSTVNATADPSPKVIKVIDFGRSPVRSEFTIETVLTDADTGDLLDATLLGPAHISRISTPSIGDVFFDPTAEPGCENVMSLDDGIWETVAEREQTSSGVALRFTTPSDGLCETMDGNFVDLADVLYHRYMVMPPLSVSEPLTVCYQAAHPASALPVEGCATLRVLNPALPSLGR